MSVRRVPAGKVSAPVLPTGFVSRPGLVDHLDRAAPHQLVLVTAPAGYGKTLLLAEWAHQGGAPTAWVSIDRDDDSPRLWSAVGAALGALPTYAAAGGPHAQGRGAPVAPGNLVDNLVEQIEAVDEEVRLVLDDVHLLTDGESLRDLGRLVRRRPPNLRLVLSSRADPPLSLPRLRLEGGLHEVRTEHLRLSLEDAATMLRAAGLDLTAEQVARLHERTEGWAAGLRLAAIALRRTGDVEGFIADFSGDERSMADYLTGELLAGFPPETLDFLRSVSVCDRLPADLAVAVSGRQDAARLLDDLGRETALVERRPSGGYRLHPLLRTYLVANLRRHDPARHRRLHGVVARWWTAEAEPEHALLHAEWSQDEALLADSLRRTGVTLLLRGEIAAVRHALDELQHGGRSADPWLTLVAALAHIDERALPAAAAALRRARSAWPSSPGPDLCALRLSAELLGAAVGLTITDPLVAPTDGTAPAAELDALLRASRTVAGLADDRWDGGSAQRDLEAAVAVARSHGSTFLEVQALCTLALVHAGRCDFPAMIDAARDAVRVASQHGRHPSAWTARASAIQAYADLLAGRPAAARRWTANALEVGPLALPPETRYSLRAIHGAAVADEGDRAAGLAEMRAARSELSGVLWPPAVPAALALLEHRGALLHGNPAAAKEVLAWLERRTGRVGEVLLLEAWAELAAGRYDAARAALAPLPAGTVRTLLPHTCIETDLVEAEVALHAGDVPTGTAALDRALRAAAEWGVVRPFVLAGPRTRAVLAGRPAERGTGGFSARLAAAWEAVRADAAAPLSERELVVLALLPSLMSAGEIAAELTVSVNTVKSHIRSIYAKLGASTRRDAVRQAHERGLLS